MLIIIIIAIATTVTVTATSATVAIIVTYLEQLIYFMNILLDVVYKLMRI